MPSSVLQKCLVFTIELTALLPGSHCTVQMQSSVAMLHTTANTNDTKQAGKLCLLQGSMSGSFLFQGVKSGSKYFVPVSVSSG